MNPELEKSLLLCPNLPTLSAVALKIVALARQPDADIGELAGLLAKDPALAGKILRVANSPFYQQRRQSRNIRQAVLVLGLDATVTLALGFSLAETFRHAPDIAGLNVWRRSLISALACRVLAETRGLRSLEELLLAGLLQDLGILALAAALPDTYGAIAAEACSHDELIRLEDEAFGADHSAAGAWLMRSWRLPDYLPFTAEASHTPNESRAPADLAPFVACVAVSGRIADIYVNDDPRRDTAAAAHAAKTWLGLEREDLQRVLQRVSDTLPEIEALFEEELLTPEQVSGITDIACELLTTRSLQTLDALRDQQARTGEFEAAKEQLREEARRDALTGVHNRGHFDEVFEKEFLRAKESGWPLSIGFLDLDHFKAVNDSHGHPVGDVVLAAVGTALSEQLRYGDVVARYGGEEFVFILPGTPQAEAKSIAERIRSAIDESTYEFESGETVRVTASIGVATYRPGESAHETAGQLLREADQALYRAKDQGRNRVATIDPADAD